jgi:periplasmic divalent cation tolerance protein
VAAGTEVRSMSGFIVVLVTASSPGEGGSIAATLVERRLCACVNMIPGIRSTYWWEGEVRHDDEVLLLCKAREEDFDRIERVVKETHSYDVPEIIALPVSGGSRKYLDWLFAETQNEGTGREKDSDR